MSVATAQKFAQTYASDETLRNKLQSAGSSEEKQKVLADAGFGDVTKADVDALKGGGELSEDELGKVSGAGQVRDMYDDTKYVAEDVISEIGGLFDW